MSTPFRVETFEPEMFGPAAGGDLLARIQEILLQREVAVVALPFGRTPRAVYAYWLTQPFDWSRVVLVNGDEYLGAANDHPDSCARFLRDHLLAALLRDPPESRRLRPEHLRLLNGAAEPDRELAAHMDFIRARGGLDLAILGIGAGPGWPSYRRVRWLHGVPGGSALLQRWAGRRSSIHLWFNERGSALDAPTRVTPLDPATRRANRVAFDSALTLGLAETAAARQLVLLATGKRKRSAIDLLLRGSMSPRVPASILTAEGTRSRVTLLADHEALGTRRSRPAADPAVLMRPERPPLRFVESYSGVRGTIGAGPELSAEAELLALAYAYGYLRLLVARWRGRPAPMPACLRVVVGRDSRPSGRRLAQLQIAGFLAAARDLGVDVEILDHGVVTTPLIQAAVRELEAHGGVIVTGSHNPSLDNGMKYLSGYREPELDSRNDAGAVIDGRKMGAVIQAARWRLMGVAAGGSSPGRETGHEVVSRVSPEDSLDTYRRAVRGVFRLAPDEVEAIRARAAKVVVDPNGGGGCAILPAVLGDYAQVVAINTEPGDFAHQIEPVGEALADAIAAVGEHDADLAVVADADADRGNLVVRTATGATRELHPQEVAMLSVAGALAWTRAHPGRYPELGERRLAVVAHGATSARVEAVATAFDADYVEVETGEVNVLERMLQLEADGRFVPVGVEGSNGGSLFAGTRVRDGALTALLGVLVLTSPETVASLREVFGQRPDGLPGSLGELLAFLPAYSTLQGKVNIAGVDTDPRRIKQQFEAGLDGAMQTDGSAGFRLRDVPCRFVDHELRNYEETRVLLGRGNRVTQTGGVKLSLGDESGRRHFAWFRISKTEAGVARLVADSPDPQIARGLYEFIEHAVSSAIQAAAV